MKKYVQHSSNKPRKPLQWKRTEGYLHRTSIFRSPLFPLAILTWQSTNYPHAVATTWSLSFQKVAQNPAAAELLQLCAFLAPDAIPEELIIKGSPYWSSSLQQAAADPFAFDRAIADLLKFSLIKRSPEHKTISIHRLVQAVVKDALEYDTQQCLAKRIIRALNEVVPFHIRGETAYRQCVNCLDQVQVCESMIRQYMLICSEAVDLLNQASLFFGTRARLYTIAEPLSLHALAICEQQLGPEHPNTATSLNNLACLYKERRQRFTEAEPLFLRALAIRERQLGSEHPNTAATLNDLACLYKEQRQRFTEAEPLFLRALAIRERQLGSEHLDTATTLDNLAHLYQEQGRFTEAEPLFLRVLAIFEQQYEQVGSDSIHACLKTLAQLCSKQGRYAEAEAFFLRALAIFEQQHGPEDSATIIDLMDLAPWYEKQGRLVEAEPLLRRVVVFFEQQLEPEDGHLDVTISWLRSLAVLYDKQERYAEAEPVYHCAHAAEKTLPQGRGITGVK